MDRKFSRIENLWPRDGSCPLPLRSKRIFNKCFRIVKTQKISREFRCSCMLIAVCSERSSCPCFAAALTKSRYHVRSAYEIFKVLPPKKKNAAPQQAKNFVGVKRRQNDRVCCRAVRSFRAIAHRKVVVITVSTTTFQCDL